MSNTIRIKKRAASGFKEYYLEGNINVSEGYTA